MFLTGRFFKKGLASEKICCKVKVKVLSMFKISSDCQKKNAVLLKVQSSKLYNNKCMIASTQATTTEIFEFIAVIIFRLLSLKVKAE